jgi:hypothetical protein
MSTIESRFHVAIAAMFTAGLCWLTPMAEEPDEWRDQQKFSLDPEDNDACLKQMNRIYAALQQYYKKYQRFPNRLSELIPEFVLGHGDLTCPYVTRSGDRTKYRLHVDQSVFDDPGSTYAYEFSNKSPYWGPELTYAEVKRHHMKFFGFGMPIVRCFAHRPRLNLAFGGTVYQSNFEWEDAYLTCREQRKVFHENLSDTNLIAIKLVEASLPLRDYADLTPRQLDLSASYNAPLSHLSQMNRRGQLLMTYPRSAEFIDGVFFDVRALIHLGGHNFPIPFPLSIEGIPVEAHCERIRFLHGIVLAPHSSASSIASGSTNSVYSISFADGHLEEFAIMNGKDVKTLWYSPDEPSQEGDANPDWVLPLPETRTALRLFVATWQNPFPARQVKSVSIRSHATNCAPFLVAITLDASEHGDQPE